jgi:hypothetical protein
MSYGASSVRNQCARRLFSAAHKRERFIPERKSYLKLGHYLTSPKVDDGGKDLVYGKRRSAMRRKTTTNGRNWREWLENRPLVILVGVAVAVSSTTLAVAKYFFDQKKEIAEQLHAAELQRTRDDLTQKIKEAESRFLSIERHVGNETIWDLSKVLVSESQARALGSEFTYFDDLQVYLSIPKSEAWTFKEMNEAEAVGMLLGPNWLKQILETPMGRMMSGYKVYCWRGPAAFEIETGHAELPVFNTFPYVFIERVNNQKLRQATGTFIDQQELEAKQKEVQEAKRTLDEKQSEKALADTAPMSPSALGAKSPGPEATKPGSASSSDAEAKETVLNLFLGSDIVGYFLNYNLESVIQTAALVKGASFGILNTEKKGNVFYIHSEIVFPASGTRPKIYLEKESICIGDTEDTVMIQTSAPSTDRRPPEATWINSWLAGLRVVSR